MASVLQLILRSKKEGTATKDTTKELGGLEKMAKKVGIAFVAMAAAKTIKNATLLAARVETLGIVTKTLGRSAGKTEFEIRSLERSIVDQGITLQGSRQAIAMMIQSNVDLAHATDLARLAQDTAVIANLNSSEAFQQLTYVLQTGNVRMARTLGLNVQFGKAQQELAKSLGKTTAELSEQEVMQARTNAVMKAGERIAGTYEAAMGTAGKKMLSMDRQLEELSRILGEGFLPALESVVSVLYEAANALNSTMSAQKFYDEAVRDGIITEEMAAEVRRDLNKATWDGRDAASVAKQHAAALDAEYKKFYNTLLLVTDAEYELSAEYLKQHGRVERLAEEVRELTEAEYYEMAAEALLAGKAALAQHYVDMATKTGIARDRVLDLIKQLQNLNGMVVTYTITGAQYGPSRRDLGAPDVAPSGNSEQARKIALWDAAHPSGEDSSGRGNPYRQHGGPVEEGKPYIVGEKGAELFVPSQSGDIYNQQQLAGGDININTGINQRAFNNMAEDWMRGLGG